MSTQLPPTEKGHSSTQFWPMSFVAKRLDGSIQDATWYGGKPRPVRRCIRWGRSYPLKGAQPQFSTHAYCDQTVGLMKTPLGTEIDIGPGHIVLDGDTAPPKSGTSALSFRPLSIVATVAHLSYC